MHYRGLCNTLVQLLWYLREDDREGTTGARLANTNSEKHSLIVGTKCSINDKQCVACLPLNDLQRLRTPKEDLNNLGNSITVGVSTNLFM